MILNRIKIALADDNEEMLSILKEILEPISVSLIIALQRARIILWLLQSFNFYLCCPADSE